ncbi:MAG: RNA helicase [Hyphomicrobium sp.]|nr:MAG: RNA helicase [Hyphomicrobium sp.]
MTTFSELGLLPLIEKALDAEGYVTPTPIQIKAIPIVKSGADLLGIAQTGTGKTAAFALPILNRLAADRRPPMHKGCRALILSPTRELATQIAESFRTYGRFLDLRVAVIFGGVAHRPQTNAMARGVDVLVATPGRLLDHIAERNLSLTGTEIFVLDEADQMLDLGFMKPIRKIVSMLSTKRQNLFFSATMPHEIGALAAELLHNPQRVEIAPAATTIEKVDQRVIFIEHPKKRALLIELFADPVMARTLIFTRTKRGADRVTQHLESAGIVAAAIHGNKSQQQRERALESFRASKVRVLVATDIAARGIDIDLVSHVINYELPEVPEQYVHRIGRTARAGASGVAISLCDNDERGLLRDIERVTRQQIPQEDRRNDKSLPSAPASERQASRAEGRGGDRRNGGGNRSSGSQRNGAGFGSGNRGADARGPRGPRTGEPRRDGRPDDRRGDRPQYRGDNSRSDRTPDRPIGLISAGGWTPLMGEPQVVSDRDRDDRPRSNRPADTRPARRLDDRRGIEHRQADSRKPDHHRGESRPERPSENRQSDSRGTPRSASKPAFGRPQQGRSAGGAQRNGRKAGY